MNPYRFMPRPLTATTDVTTAQRISVGLMVGTATLVVLSAIIAGIYTLTKTSVGTTTTTTQTLSPAESTPLPKVKDRTLQLP